MELGLGKGSIMRLPKSCRPEPFCRGKQYIGKYLVGFGVAAALMALCMGWLVYDAAAQTNEAPDDGILTVRECLRKANTSVGPVGQALIKEGIIEKNLLPTKVTNDMCEDILKRAPDGSSVQTLVAAQNYIQGIKLIENSIRGAAGEAAAKGIDAKGTDHHFLADKALEAAPIGWQLFLLGSSQGDSTAFPLCFDTYATRLLAQALSAGTEQIIYARWPLSETNFA